MRALIRTVRNRSERGAREQTLGNAVVQTRRTRDFLEGEMGGVLLRRAQAAVAAAAAFTIRGNARSGPTRGDLGQHLLDVACREGVLHSAAHGFEFRLDGALAFAFQFCSHDLTDPSRHRQPAQACRTSDFAEIRIFDKQGQASLHEHRIQGFRAGISP
jgi:hypothetical protein